jgi:PAS domain S-box-containing protein
MKKSGNRHLKKLCRQPEKQFLTRVTRTPSPGGREADEPEFPKVDRDKLHKLCEQLIEQETQNDELRKTNFDLMVLRDRYFNLFQQAPSGYCNLSKNGLILEANLAAESLFGIPGKTLVKQPITRFIFQEDQDIFFLSCRRVWTTGTQQSVELRMLPTNTPPLWTRLAINIINGIGDEPRLGLLFSDFTGYQRNKETRRPVNDILENRLAEQLNELRKTIEVLEWEIAERKNAVKALGLDEDKSWLELTEIHAIYDSAPIGLAVIDHNFQYTRINKRLAEITELLPEDHIKKSFHQIVPGLGPILQDLCERIFQTGECLLNIEFTFDSLRKPGIQRHCVGSFIPLKDKGGRVVSISVIVEEITEKKMAEQQLKELNTSLEKRVAEKTAEVQNLVGYLRTLVVELAQAEHQEKHRLAMVLHDSLQPLLVGTLMRLESLPGRLFSAGEAIIHEIESLIREAIATSRSLSVELFPPVLHQASLREAFSWLIRSMEKKHKLKVHFHATIGVTHFSPETNTLLFMAVREILLNTLKHSGTHEAYLTMLRIKEDRFWIIVEDRGKGFEPKTILGEGSGSGLFSIQQRLQFLGGRFCIESAPDQGTKVILEIPWGSTVPEETRSTASFPDKKTQESAQNKNSQIRVILADDHQILRQGLCSLLQAEPDIRIVGEAENGLQAVDLARQLLPAVIIMDLNMPIMNGVQATMILTQEMPQIKIIALSMYEAEDNGAAMYEKGAVAFLTKGCPSKDLVAAIRKNHQTIVPPEK